MSAVNIARMLLKQTIMKLPGAFLSTFGLAFLMVLGVVICWPISSVLADCSEAAAFLAGKKNDPPEVFRRLFRSKAIYRDADCHNNVYRLLDRMKNVPGFRVDQAKVVFAYPNEHAGEVNSFSVNTKIARDYEGWETEVWNYHVFIEYRGQIYDLDYGNSGEVVGAAKFMNDTFAKGDTSRHSDIYPVDLLEVPADAYLKAHPKPPQAWDKVTPRPRHQGWITGRTKVDGSRRISVTKFLQEKEGQQ